MGFRQGAYFTIWEVNEGKFANTANVRMTSSRKNKNGEYEQDFSSYVTFIGEAAKQVMGLGERDRIKILSCDVTNQYDKAKRITYTNYKVFEFEMADGSKLGGKSKPKPQRQAFADDDFAVDYDEDENIPF